LIPVSVVIVTKNEEKNIGDALESARDFSEIVVIDSFSSDRTLDICKKYTGNVYQEQWEGYARQKQKGIDRASLSWVLILDADERITRELKSEIASTLKDKNCSGFYIPRKNFFLDRWIRHGGWWPDYTLRLFRRDKAYIEEREVHEKVIVQGSTGYLRNPMEHYTSRTLSDFLKKQEDYSTLAAKEMHRQGFRAGTLSFTVRPFFTFLKMFFFKMGFLDGKRGLILAFLYSYYTFLKYVKTWEKGRK